MLARLQQQVKRGQGVGHHGHTHLLLRVRQRARHRHHLHSFINRTSSLRSIICFLLKMTDPVKQTTDLLRLLEGILVERAAGC